MPVLSLDEYLDQQRIAQGQEFLQKLGQSGTDVNQFKQPDGSFFIPIANGLPDPAPASPDGREPGAFTRGALQVGSDLASTAQLATKALGLPDMAGFFEQKANEYSSRAAAIPSAVPSYQDIDSLENLATYIYERTAENVPMLASLMIPGGAASIVARGVGMAPKVAKGIGWTTAALTDVGLQTGESATIAREAGQDPVDVRVIGSGLGKAVLDFLPLFTVAKAVGISPILEKNLIAQLREMGYLKRVAANIPLIAAVEVPTEVMQEAINIALDRSLKEKEGELSEEDWNQLWNAAAAAGAVAVGLGPATALGRPQVREAPPPDVPDGGLPPDIGAGNTPPSPVDIPQPQSTVTGEPAPMPTGPLKPEAGLISSVEEYAAPSVFDSNSFYDPKTGAPKVTAEELRKALLASSETIQYDPAVDKIIGLEKDHTLRQTKPEWVSQEGGRLQLGEDAQIVPGQAGPEGQQTYDVWNSAGINLGNFPTPQAAMERAEKYAWERKPRVGINVDGQSVIGSPIAGERLAADMARQNPNPTQTDQAIIKIDEARTYADGRTDLFQEVPKGAEEISLAQLDPGMQRLLEARSDVLADKENYRNDGGLSSKGQKKLDTMNTRVGAYATKLGIPNPLSSLNEHMLSGDVESQLATLAQDSEVQRGLPKYKNLSKSEEALFDKLNEKEMVEGLTENEYYRLSLLDEKIREGDVGKLYRKPTLAEIEEIRKDLNDVEQIMAEEAARVKRQGSGVMASMDQDGKYLFSRNGNLIAFPEFKVKENPFGAEVSLKGKPIGFVFMGQNGKYYTYRANEAKARKPWMWTQISNLKHDDRTAAEGYEYNPSGSPTGQKHPDGWVVKNKDGTWTAGTNYQNITGNKELGSFPSREEAQKAVEAMQAKPESEEDAGMLSSMLDEETGVSQPKALGVFGSLREAIAVLRKRAIMDMMASKSTPASALRDKLRSISFEKLIKAISPIYANMQIKPKLRIVRLSELSGKERDFAETAAGFISLDRAGEISLVLDNIFSADQAKLVFVHEALLHYGVRAFMNPQELQVLLKEVLAYRAKEIKENARARGELGDQDSNFSTRPLNLRDAEEFLATKMEEAWIRWNAGDKDWMRDTVWEKPGDRTWVEKIIAFFRRVMRRIGVALGRDRWTDSEVAAMLKDVALFMSGKITGRNTVGIDAHWKTGVMAKTVGRANLADAVPNMNSWSEVWGTKLATMFLTPLQIAERYSVPGAAKYVERVQLWWARKRDLTVDAVGVAEDWQKFPKREVSKFAQALFEINSQSEELKRRLTDEEVSRVMKEAGVGESTAALYPRIDKTFQDVLAKLQSGLELNALVEHTRDSVKAQELHNLWKQQDHKAFFAKSKEILGNLEVGGRLTEIEREMNALRERNYFPHMRFGRYGVFIRAKQDLTISGQDFKGPHRREDGSQARGQVVYFETFEKYHDRDSRTRELMKEFPARLYDMGYGMISDAEFTFLGMPPALYEALRGKLNLTEQQAELLKELYFTRSPGRAFLKHLTKRRGIEGFSQDALRVYSSYMMNAANHIARVEYHREMGDALTELRTAGSEMGDVAGLVRDYFAKHFDYIMNPENDWASIRSLGFLWYLGFNVKSALVNLTQVPMVAYPYLASVYGDSRAVGALAKNYGTVVGLMRGRSVLDEAAATDLERGMREGFIDESQATELAAIAEVPVLQRLLPMNGGEKRLRDLSYYGSVMFRHAETFNRRVVFLAARELAIQQGLKGEDIFLAARKAVQTTMFEYAKWNRPTFMRGKKSVFFLFWNYLQHLSYLAWGGEGKNTAIRVWGLLLLTAGLQGLPFAEDILDLADFGSTKAKELLGSKDPRTDLRLELREIAQALTDRPDLVMHGLSRYYGLGPLHAMQLLGVPVPGVDTSGSLSAGRIVPGLEDVLAPSRDPDKQLGSALVDALGPVTGIGYGFWKVLTSRDPDQWKTWERAMPTAMKSASQATRRWQRGAETFRGGGSVATFDPHDTEHRAELVANALGFQPSRVTDRYELRSLQEELKQYWLARRALVLENYAYAWMSHDPEAISDVKEAVRRFNSEAPAPALKVSLDTLQNSLQQRLRRADLRTEGLPSETAFVPLYKRVAQAFPELESQSSEPPPTE
jgi:hypothetical protein